jgi:hypothetical protein
MSEFVLIVMFAVASVTGRDSRGDMAQSKAVAMQEFRSIESCRSAARTLEPFVFMAICVPK